MTPRRKAEPAVGNGSGVVLADRYRLEERVAAGGMGEVWRATDTLLERIVAVKLLRESLAQDPVVSERFRREALLAAQISHPNMAGVFDYVQSHDRPGIVMEFVDGETLAERLARGGSLAVGEAVRICMGLLAALASAHDTGIVHRDVKPGNVMLTASGDIKVTDFGIARAASDHTLTETGMVIGTAHYLAPEQVSGGQATPSSDLYAVGAILYEMLAGRRPFEAPTPIAVAMKRLTEDPAPLRTLRDDVPEPVTLVVDRALARDPSGRYGSAAEMRTALESALASSQPATQPQRVDPTPTMVLPLDEIEDAARTAAIRPAQGAPPPPTPAPVTGQEPAPLVAERRRRDVRRGLVYAVLLAAAVAGIVLLILALTGGRVVVDVPNFNGLTVAQARTKASDLGIRIREVPRDSELPAGRVTGQSIPAGTPVGSDVVVTIGVSTGNPPAPAEVDVPSVVGMDKAEAEDVLNQAGFGVKVNEAATSSFDAGQVIGQYPPSGEMAPQGSDVTIVVATQPTRGRGKGKGNEG